MRWNASLAAGLVIGAIEDRAGVPGVVHRPELRRIEEPSAAFGVNRGKVAPARGPGRERGILADGAEGAVGCQEIAGELLAESGTRGRIDHQAGLVSVLRRGRSGDHFHGLNRIGGNRRRKNFVALVGDGLAVDDVADLGMVAERVEKTVRIGGDARRGEDDRIVQTGIGGERGKRGQKLAIDVSLGAGLFSTIRSGLASTVTLVCCVAISRRTGRSSGTAVRISTLGVVRLETAERDAQTVTDSEGCC